MVMFLVYIKKIIGSNPILLTLYDGSNLPNFKRFKTKKRAK